MSNTLTNLIPDIHKALDVVSRELVGFIPAVNRNSTVEGAAKDQLVDVPVVGASASADITPGVTAPDTGDFAPANVKVGITKSKMVPVRWNGEEQRAVKFTGIYPSIQQQRFEQAFRTLTNEVEADVAGLHILASRAYGAAGTTPFGTAGELDDFSKTLQILHDNGAPGDMQMVIGSAALANAQGYQSGLIRVDASGSDTALRTGNIGNVFNSQIRTSGGIKDFTKGGGSLYTAISLAVGTTSIPLITGTGTVLVGDVVTFAGDTNKYVVASSPIAAPGTIVIAEPGLRIAIPAAATLMTTVASSTRNMAFSRSAIVLATRLPAMPEEGDQASDVMVVTDPHSGLSFQIAMYKQYKQVHYEVGLAWGQQMIAPRHCALLLG